MLQQDRVARHDIGDAVANDLIEREVPGLNAENHALRLIADQRTAAVERALLVAELVGRGIGGVFTDRGTELDFIAALRDRLAHLAGHERGIVVLAGTQPLGDFAQNAAALFQSGGAPLQKRLVRIAQRLQRLFVAGQFVGRDDFAVGGIDRLLRLGHVEAPVYMLEKCHAARRRQNDFTVYRIAHALCICSGIWTP